MSTTSPEPPPAGAPILCLDDPVVDLICERRAALALLQAGACERWGALE